MRRQFMEIIMRSAKINYLTILILAVALCICGSAFAEKPADKAKTPETPPAVKKPLPAKKPSGRHTFGKDSKPFSDEQFIAYLKGFFPIEAENLKTFEKQPKAYQTKIKALRVSYRRLIKAYRYDPEYGKLLVTEVKLRIKRNGILDKLKAAKTKQDKTKLRAELSNTVSKEFDIAVKVKRFKYEQLRARIKKMEKHLATREEEVKKLVTRKDAEIKLRIEELIKGEEKTNWK